MRSDTKVIIMFLLPLILITGVFLYYPFFKSFLLSFYHSDGFFNSTFIGYENYTKLIKDKTFQIAMINSIKMVVYTVFFQVGIALVLAVMVSAIKKGQGFFRMTFFFPIIISGAAIGLLFQLVYNYYNGLLNSILTGLGHDPILWITEKSSFTIVAVPTVWQYVGFYFIILLTAMLKIPEEFYEAAKIEGVEGFKKTTMITIPLIWSDVKVCLILAITGALKVFELVYIITRGGPLDSSQVLGTYLYQQAFMSQRFGYASAIAVIIVILGVTLALVTNRLLRRDEITY